ncbi:MAG: tRNA guanosine(34) transglycosylase Tgt [Planctomycetota bacterium]
MPPPVTFHKTQDDADPASNARLGVMRTPHGDVPTPGFMPVGTSAAVKGLQPDAVFDAGARCILCNTYHLMLRPGEALVKQMGGLHTFMRWPGAIITDSGGFQVFSLTRENQIDDDGVSFKSHLTGEAIRLTPERSMQVQNDLGADIAMAFDDCPPAPAPSAHQAERARALGRDPGPTMSPAEYHDRLVRAAERSRKWLERCAEAHARPDDQALFGIVQGGGDLELRTQCAADLGALDLPGYAIGGVAVGEGPDDIARVVRHTAPLLPADKPRYLMGVGYERDLVAGARAGVDVFDCVLPTRNGRNAVAFTPTGPLRLRNARFRDDPGPLDPTCDCPACRQGQGGFSRAYLRHLFVVGEALGPALVSAHNVRHFQRLMLDIRRAIRDDRWATLAQDWPVVGGIEIAPDPDPRPESTAVSGPAEDELPSEPRQ